MDLKARLAEVLKKTKESVSQTVETVKSKVAKKPTKSTPDGDGKSPDGLKIKKFAVSVIKTFKERLKKKEPEFPLGDLQLEIFISDVDYGSILQQAEDMGIVEKKWTIFSKFIPKHRKSAIWVIKRYENKIVEELNERLKKEGLSFTVHNLVPFEPKPKGMELGFCLNIGDIDYPSLITKMQRDLDYELLAALKPMIQEIIAIGVDKFLDMILQDRKKHFVVKFISDYKKEVISFLNDLAKTENFELTVAGFECKVIAENPEDNIITKIIKKIDEVSEELDLWLKPKYPFIVLFFILPVIVAGLLTRKYGAQNITGFGSYLIFMFTHFFITLTFSFRSLPPLLKTVMIYGFLGIVFLVLIPYLFSVFAFSFIAVNILSTIAGCIFIILAAIFFACNFLLFFKSW